MNSNLDFLLEVIRIFKPDQRKWIVRIFIVSGITMISSRFWEPWIEAILEKHLSVDLSYASLPGWILIAIGVSLYLFNYWQERESRKEPTFREEHETVMLSLGGGMTCSYSKEQLKTIPRYPFDLGGHLPIKVYIDKSKLYADVEIFAESGLGPITITKNVLSGLPHNWDSNKNENALEIVNNHGSPMYQLVYKSNGHISLCGVFPSPGGLVLADDTHMVTNPSLPAPLTLKRIFKYPSWKYPAVFETY